MTTEPSVFGGSTDATPSSFATSADHACTCSVVPWVTTTTSGPASAGQRASMVSNAVRCGDPTGIRSGPEERRCMPRAGIAASRSTAVTPMATGQASRWTRPGEPGEHAFRRSDVAHPGQHAAQPRHPGRQAGAHQPSSGQRQQRRDEPQGDEQRHDDDADSGGTDGPQDLRGEEHQPGQADRHDEPGEQHGSSGHGDGATDRGHDLLGAGLARRPRAGRAAPPGSG